MEKYYYKISSFYPYDGMSGMKILSHEKSFSKEEIDDMVVEAILEKILNKRNEGINEINCYSEGDFLYKEDEIVEKYNKYKKFYKKHREDELTLEKYKEISEIKWWTRFSCIDLDVYQILIDKYNFEPLEFKDEVSIDESKKIVDPNEDYEDYREDKILNKVREKFWEKKK